MIIHCPSCDLLLPGNLWVMCLHPKEPEHHGELGSDSDKEGYPFLVHVSNVEFYVVGDGPPPQWGLHPVLGHGEGVAVAEVVAGASWRGGCL